MTSQRIGSVIFNLFKYNALPNTKRCLSTTMGCQSQLIPARERKKQPDPLPASMMYPELKGLPEDQHMAVKRTLKLFDIGNPKVLESHPWLLLMDPLLISKRLKSVRASCVSHGVDSIPFKLRLNLLAFNEKVIDQLVRCLTLGKNPLHRHLQRIEYMDERVSFFCQELETTAFDIISKLDFGTNCYMILRPLHDIEMMIKMLREELTFTNKDILDHRFLFSRRIVSLRRRIKRLNDNNLPILPWSLSCSHALIDAIREYERSYELQLNSVPVLLQKQLNITQKDFVSMANMNKTLTRKKPFAIHKILSLLLEEGYTGQDIVKNPQVLSATPDVIEKRLKEIKPIGKVVSLEYLRYQDRRFYQMLQVAKKQVV